jgi:aminopeptidase
VAGAHANRGIDRPTDQIRFDEKMAGTVHLALGRAYGSCLPNGESGVEIDGERIQHNGQFRRETEC